MINANIENIRDAINNISLDNAAQMDDILQELDEYDFWYFEEEGVIRNIYFNPDVADGTGQWVINYYTDNHNPELTVAKIKDALYNNRFTDEMRATIYENAAVYLYDAEIKDIDFINYTKSVVNCCKTEPELVAEHLLEQQVQTETNLFNVEDNDPQFNFYNNTMNLYIVQTSFLNQIEDALREDTLMGDEGYYDTYVEITLDDGVPIVTSLIAIVQNDNVPDDKSSYRLKINREISDKIMPNIERTLEEWLGQSVEELFDELSAAEEPEPISNSFVPDDIDHNDPNKNLDI